MAKYIVNGAKCKCTLSTSEGMLEVKSQSKIFIQNKLMATENEKTFLPNFISCNKTHPPTSCQPDITASWNNTKSDAFQSKQKGLLEDSNCTCNSGGKISIVDSKQSEPKIVIFGDYSSEPKEISKVYAKVRTLNDYSGEFGFDWIDVDPETTEIQKIQGVPFSDVEYFYKKGNSSQDLGDIIPVSQDKSGAIQAIQENYGLINFCDYVDTPFVLLKPGQEITLSVEVFFEGDAQDDYISITGDEYYDFDFVDEDKNEKTKKKKIVANEKLKLKIKCLKESFDKTYYFLHTGIKGPREIGGLSMMENKVLKLKFRVIALVSNEGNPSAKARALFEKFANAGVGEYLNKKSLNQGGYEVEIENQEMFNNLNNPDVNLDDYFYAFDKEDWKSKKYFDIKENNGITIETLFQNIEVNSQTISLDFVTIEEYNKTKSYSGGLIILADYNCTNDNTGAFSRTSPLNHYALMVYSTNTVAKDTYAHEIGHMLGLPHLFYDSKEKDAYRIARENILGNGKPEFIIINGKQVENPDCILSIDRQIQKSLSETINYIRKEVYARKSTLITQLLHSNTFFINEKNKQQINKTRIENLYRGQPDSVIVAGSGSNTQTKGEYLSICNKIISNYTKYTQENTSAVNQLNSLKDNDKIKNHKYDIYFKASHYTVILRETKIYHYNTINQIHSNYLIFKQATTKNIMDYNSDKTFYFHNQIKVMRDDLQNY